MRASGALGENYKRNALFLKNKETRETRARFSTEGRDSKKFTQILAISLQIFCANFLSTNTHHVEGGLGQVVVLALQHALEAADRVLQLDVATGLSSEDLRWMIYFI